MGKIEYIRAAIRISERALADTIHLIRPGTKEKEIARHLYKKIRSYGADGFSFRPIVASGERSALPHGRATDKKIKSGDIVVVDFGARYKGFRSDLTRSYVIGRPTARQKNIQRIVLEAQKRAIRKIFHGAAVWAVDMAARQYIKRRGFGRYFIHSTGHGIGKKVHEAPKISWKNKMAVLRSGMVVTVEPGIYIKGWGGMRIEDMVLVTKRGCKLLTGSPKERLSI